MGDAGASSNPRHLTINQDLPFQRATWKAQRILWIVMALFLLAGLAGAFGGGGFFVVHAHSPSGEVEIRHEKFSRSGAVTNLTIHVRRNTPLAAEIPIRISREILRDANFASVDPQSERETSTADARVIWIACAPGTNETVVNIALVPSRSGRLAGPVQVGEDAPIRFSQFVFP